MTQKDGSPEVSEGPYWSEELLAVLVGGLGDEAQARVRALMPQTQEHLPHRSVDTVDGSRCAGDPGNCAPGEDR